MSYSVRHLPTLLNIFLCSLARLQIIAFSGEVGTTQVLKIANLVRALMPPFAWIEPAVV